MEHNGRPARLGLTLIAYTVEYHFFQREKGAPLGFPEVRQSYDTIRTSLLL